MQSLEEVKAKYGVDEAHYVEDMHSILAGVNPLCLHLLQGINTDRFVLLQHLAQLTMPDLSSPFFTLSSQCSPIPEHGSGDSVHA